MAKNIHTHTHTHIPHKEHGHDRSIERKRFCSKVATTHVSCVETLQNVDLTP